MRLRWNGGYLELFETFKGEEGWRRGRGRGRWQAE
jgi:hypothetical protein